MSNSPPSSGLVMTIWGDRSAKRIEAPLRKGCGYTEPDPNSDVSRHEDGGRYQGLSCLLRTEFFHLLLQFSQLDKFEDSGCGARHHHVYHHHRPHDENQHEVESGPRLQS